MDTPKPIHGLYAAMLVPRDSEGRLHEPYFRTAVEFLAERGVRRLVLNGATGEYCLTPEVDFRRTLAICRDVLGSSAELLAGIGSAGISGTLALADAARVYAVKALLLPMPHFFPYEQQDLLAWCETVAHSVATPVLLYNLPRFTTPLAAPTVTTLLASVPNLIGIKDSSGTLDILASLTASGSSASRIVGDDRVLPRALAERVCDGVVSGVAGVLPELISYLWSLRDDTQSLEFRDAAVLLEDLVSHLSTLPTPWALKWLAEARGLAPAGFSQPLSPERVRQGADLVAWFLRWWPAVSDLVTSVRTLPASPPHRDTASCDRAR